MNNHPHQDNYIPEVVKKAADALIAYDASNSQTQLLAEQFLDAAYVAWLSYQENPELLATHLQASGVKLTGHSKRSPFSPICRLLLTKAQIDSGAPLKFNHTRFVSKHARQLDAVHSEFLKERKEHNQPPPSRMTVNPGDIESFIQSCGGIQQLVALHDMIDADEVTQEEIDEWLGDTVKIQHINKDGSLSDRKTTPYHLAAGISAPPPECNSSIDDKGIDLSLSTYSLAIIKTEDAGGLKMIKYLGEVTKDAVCKKILKDRNSNSKQVHADDDDDILLKLFKIDVANK